MRNGIEREREKSSGERHSLASQLEQSMKESKDLSFLLRQRDEVSLTPPPSVVFATGSLTMPDVSWECCSGPDSSKSD